MRARELEVGECQPLDGAGNDDVAAYMDFHTEPGVNSAEFQETSAQRTARKIRFPPVGEELAAAEANEARPALDYHDFVDVVAGDNCKWLK